MKAAAVSGSVLALGLLAGLATALPVQAQEDPPTTLPFEPTVPSAPPERSTYPDRRPQAETPPPGDPFCNEIGPIIRAGVVASRFATLSPSTAEGAAIGRFEAGEALKSLGADTCIVVIPAAAPETADSPYNQVTCRLESEQGDAAYLDDMRETRDRLGKRIGKCPAVSEWTAAPPDAVSLEQGDVIEDYRFTHPDVGVEMLVRAAHHSKTGQWPQDHLRTLSLIFRTPNPDRPEPPEPETDAASGGN
ncbi:hypothetical protein [Henriciella aquimarina]|uniref:hypothetical protein n=1 Tax=Henriciella aquimarina TaxID=545261 RepID=UPI000A043530|nr:hypothetical protein [Henriciella aquimarina]